MSWFSLNMTNISVGADGGPPGDQPRNELLARVEITLLTAIFISAGILNVGLMTRRLCRMRVFVFNLCVADLVVTFFQVCSQLAWVCRAGKYLQVVGMFASAYMVVVMTVDRHQAVCRPMVTFQRRRARWNVPICVARLPPRGSAPGFHLLPGRGLLRGVRLLGALRHAVGAAGLRHLDHAGVLMCQVRICRAVRLNFHMETCQSADRSTTTTTASTVHSEALRSRARGVGGLSKATLKMTVVIVVAYVLCFAPFFTVQLWAAWDSEAPTESEESYLVCCVEIRMEMD
ncbi:hypothetical protein NHX12_026809 [Muraenolepis orangiensis]|uniref:Vasopressin V2 receptor n=1 Tax=Muraenolepis orangiensis TaxID=630683 RepID=A0A9Q0D3A7_9TELE|nr:hypothetical protein NHX12_026809 [Muraenolepis orangiensis]